MSESESDYKNMRFFVFQEFHNMELLEKVRIALPGIDVPKYTSRNEAPENDVRIRNAKLFFDKARVDKASVDKALDILCEIGLDIVCKRPCLIRKDKKTGKITHLYMDDRVILKLRE